MVLTADVTIGGNLRRIRLERLIGLEQLALSTGIEAQMLAAYEVGAQRISAPVLYDLAVALDSPISAFFVTTEHTPENREPAMQPAVH